MKAVIIDTFNYFDIRTKYVRNALISQGYDVTMIVSDFDHITKSTRVEKREQTVFVSTFPYTKNISIGRIRSHLNFSKKAMELVNSISPDLIYCLLPLNSLAKKIHKYHIKHKNVKVFFDIYDLWPESLPASNVIKKILFPWRKLRDNHLKCADKVFLECSYYEKFLPKGIDYSVAYLCKEERKIEFANDYGTLNFLYLGSINNIIDIDCIISLLKNVNSRRAVHLEIVGGGEAEQELLSKLQSAIIPYTNHGRIFDEDRKDEIASRCHFGLNIYKPNLSIGLTMKSIDYFIRGLPLISANIYDTKNIVNRYNCGFDLESGESVVSFLAEMTDEDWQKLKECTDRAYNDNFSVRQYEQILQENLL